MSSTVCQHLPDTTLESRKLNKDVKMDQLKQSKVRFEFLDDRHFKNFVSSPCKKVNKEDLIVWMDGQVKKLLLSL